MEVPREADSNEFLIGHLISFFSLSSLCVIYFRGRLVRIQTQKRFFLVFLLSVEVLLEADRHEF